jgi:hypothetical protein
MEEQDKFLKENLGKTKASCAISYKAILEGKEMDRGDAQQTTDDSTTLFTHETIEAAIRKQRLRNEERMNQVAQTRFGNQQPQQGEGR